MKNENQPVGQASRLSEPSNNPIKADLATAYEDYKWLYIKGWINDDL
jgi:hypothetical protein